MGDPRPKHRVATMVFVATLSQTPTGRGPVYVTDRAQLCVARTLALPLAEAGAASASLRKGDEPQHAVELPKGGRIDVKLPFRRDAWLWYGAQELTPLRTPGALYTSSNRRICSVELELAAWSRQMSELSLRPAVRAPHSWGARRLRRWFTYAHAAADQLRADLLARGAARPVVHEEPERIAVRIAV
jgi:hypothetical protein